MSAKRRAPPVPTQIALVPAAQSPAGWLQREPPARLPTAGAAVPAHAAPPAAGLGKAEPGAFGPDAARKAAEPVPETGGAAAVLEKDFAAETGFALERAAAAERVALATAQEEAPGAKSV